MLAKDIIHVHKLSRSNATHVLVGALRSTLPCARPDDTRVVIRGFWSLVCCFVSIETIKTFETPPRNHYFIPPLVWNRLYSNARVVAIRPPICGKNTRNYPFIFFGILDPYPTPALNCRYNISSSTWRDQRSLRKLSTRHIG
jgi:hypothetical protein